MSAATMAPPPIGKIKMKGESAKADTWGGGGGGSNHVRRGGREMIIRNTADTCSIMFVWHTRELNAREWRERERGGDKCVRRVGGGGRLTQEKRMRAWVEAWRKWKGWEKKTAIHAEEECGLECGGQTI